MLSYDRERKAMNRMILAVLMVCTVAIAVSAQTTRKKTMPREDATGVLIDPAFWINSPIITENSIVFFFRDKAKKVAVAGDFNGWKPSLVMEEHGTNFWQAAWTQRLRKGVYRYKLVVDNIWISDPHNTNTSVDESGQEVSSFTIASDFIPEIKNPLWLSNDYYRFSYKNLKARNVSLVGDFNNWNPYHLPLTNLGGGEFSAVIRLRPGLHTYSFVVDGEWRADPDNLRQYSDEAGNIVSVFVVPKPDRNR